MISKNLEKEVKNLKEVKFEKGIIQNEFHEFDVFNHTLAVVEALKKLTTNTETITSAYLHDIGKPIVAEPRIYEGVQQYDEQGRLRHTFPNHESVGAEMVRKMNPELFSEYSINQNNIVRLVEHHFTPMKGIKLMRKSTNYAEFISAYENMKQTIASSGTDILELMSLFTADIIGKGKELDDVNELLAVRQSILGEDNLDQIYQMQKQLGGTDRRYAVKE